MSFLELTPRQIVAQLDQYIIGQNAAKRAVAVALRNRFRRALLEPDMRPDVAPKNILMIGPTGVGKTEIARRLASLANAPLLKIEATKFTELGYVGRDVDSIARDLVDVAVAMVEKERLEEAKPRAKKAARERLLDLLAPSPRGAAQKRARRQSVRRQLSRIVAAIAAAQRNRPRAGRASQTSARPHER